MTFEVLFEKWSRRYPHLTDRLQSSLPLAAHCRYLSGNTWEVLDNGVPYYVWVSIKEKRSTCTCLEYKNGVRCKHRLAVAYAWASQVMPEQHTKPYLLIIPKETDA